METKSFLLDVPKWDLLLDEKGDLAITPNPYAVAQDVACACKTEKGECFYDNTLGIPYFDKVFARQVGLQFVQSTLQAEAKKLPYVMQASCTLIPDRQSRNTEGVIAILDTNRKDSAIYL